jgi:hemerythrin
MSCARDLFQYTRDHFAYEEDLMLRVGFPSYEAHVKSHQLLISRLNALSQQISDDMLDRSEMEHFIKHWALFHIPKADFQLAEYLSYGDTKKASLFGDLPR